MAELKGSTFQVPASNSSAHFDTTPKSFEPETRLCENDALHSEENDLTEEELRELYDTEEINRFLGLFSAFVTEVQEQDSPKNEDVQKMYLDEQSLSSSGSEPLGNDGDWTSIHSIKVPGEIPGASTFTKNTNLSEDIAYLYLLPILPPARPEAPPFTIGRLRLTLQRLYLATVPTYGPFLQDLLNLATWENPSTSLSYCVIYWLLWWQDLLLPSLVFRIMYSLLRRRIFPYPTVDDLRRHREEVVRANEFGQQVSERLSASSTALTEVWRLFKLYDHTKNKYKGKARGKAKNLMNLADGSNVGNAIGEEDPTVLDSVEDSEETKDMKHSVLQILENIAEFHERARNIVNWRRPTASRKYATMIFMTFWITLLPAQYISKLVFFLLGIFFWHVVPIIASLPPSERDRVFILLSDVPTDGEYAMELITQRVGAGLPINPPKPSRAPKKERSVDQVKAPNVGSQDTRTSRNRRHSMEWEKVGNVVTVGKSVLGDMKRLKPVGPWVHEHWPGRHPLIPVIGAFAQPQSSPDARSYPCQHSSGPGLITLTQSALLFTPLMSQTPKITISLAAVKGVKKAGMLKGLHIRYLDSLDGSKELKEDKFAWIGGRDELFARLVSSEGKRWVTI